MMEEMMEEIDSQRCGCPLDYHLADCRGYREPTKDDYLRMWEGTNWYDDE